MNGRAAGDGALGEYGGGVCRYAAHVCIPISVVQIGRHGLLGVIPITTLAISL